MKTIKLKNYPINKGPLLLINHVYKHTYLEEPEDLMPISNSYPNILLEKVAAESLITLLNEIDNQQQIIPISGYRSIEEQSNLYLSSIEEYGLSYTRKYVAKEYHSEHSSGYAIDLGLKHHVNSIINPVFNHHPITCLFKEKAKYHGFITRYPDGKDELTKISSEPWHFRYVGFPHSLLIEKNNLVLEEYIQFVSTLTYQKPLQIYDSKHRYTIFFTKDVTKAFTINDTTTYQVSGNNINGLIITLRDDNYA